MAYDQINPNGRDKIPRSARSTGTCMGNDRGSSSRSGAV